MADLGVGQVLSQATGYLTGIAQTGIGLWDRMRGERKLKQAQSFYEKNKYQIPESAKAMLGVSERQASGLRMPGEDIARSRLGAATATGLSQARQAATSSSDVLGLLSSFVGQQQMGEQDIITEGARRYDRNQLQLQNSLQMMASREKERWDYNVLYPYMQQLGQAEALQSRGTQEMSAGFAAIGGTAGDAYTGNMAQQGYDDWYNNIMGKQWQPSTMAGAKLQQTAVRRGLPSNNYNYQQPSFRPNQTPLNTWVNPIQ